MPSVEFFFDFRSPYSYLANSQLDGLSAEVVYRPMDVLGVMEAVGNSPTTVLCAAKGRYARTDLGRWAALYGAPLSPNPRMREFDGRRLLRAALAADELGLARPAIDALFAAMWAGAASLGTAAEIAQVLDAAGLDGAALEPLIDEPRLDAALAAATQRAADAGVFGAPTFVAGAQMFFGNDRLDFLRRHLEIAA